MSEPERELAHQEARRLLAEAFTDGADAMRSRVATFLMARGHMDIAPHVLTMALPEYEKRQPGERVTLRGNDTTDD